MRRQDRFSLLKKNQDYLMEWFTTEAVFVATWETVWGAATQICCRLWGVNDMEKLVRSLPFVALTIYTSFKKGKVKNGRVHSEKRQCVVTTGRCCTRRETDKEAARAARNISRSQQKGHRTTRLRWKWLISDGSRRIKLSLFWSHISSSLQWKTPIIIYVHFFLQLHLVKKLQCNYC